MKNVFNKIIKIYLVLIISLSSLPLLSYVGPGAGFAVVGSFFFIFLAFIVAIFNLITFPIRFIIRSLLKLKTLRKAKVKRIIILGFDGMDYRLTKKLLSEDKLPNFKKLQQSGTFAPLWSTEPPVSPVAWSTFATGVNPGKHNIFDFLTRDPQTYLPKLSSSDIFMPKKSIKIGKYRFFLGKPKIELLRKSRAFWKITSEHGIFSAVLRVPITFPPEKVYGVYLSGLGTPDLRGTQGSFTFFTDQPKEVSGVSDGIVEEISPNGDGSFLGEIEGPEHPLKLDGEKLKARFSLKILSEDTAELSINGEKIELKKGVLSDWTKIKFKAGITTIYGIGQWLLLETSPIKLYLSPINIDPESPAMAVSFPKIFSVYLSKKIGEFATLGMAEDTWALNEKIIDDKAFIQQTLKTQKEREKIFFDTFSKVKKGLIVTVFESTDRIQHMFWRYLDELSPAEKNSNEEEVKNAIVEIYKRMDEFLGKVLEKLKKDDLLFIVSDHGFDTFRKGVNLNKWLYDNGYIVLKDGKKTSGKWFSDVDWSKTKAYSTGLSGIFLNIKGREKHGILSKEEAEKLKREIKEKLEQLVDLETGEKVVEKAFIREEIYKGPYVLNAPDIVVGYKIGYRISWESAVGYVEGDTIVPNVRAWSGDHCFTSSQVPGIFFSNKKIKEKNPRLLDISPTVLSLFGIKKPKFVDGKDLGVEI